MYRQWCWLRVSECWMTLYVCPSTQTSRTTLTPDPPCMYVQLHMRSYELPCMYVHSYVGHLPVVYRWWYWLNESVSVYWMTDVEEVLSTLTSRTTDGDETRQHSRTLPASHTHVLRHKCTELNWTELNWTKTPLQLRCTDCTKQTNWQYSVHFTKCILKQLQFSSVQFNSFALYAPLAGLQDALTPSCIIVTWWDEPGEIESYLDN